MDKASAPPSCLTYFFIVLGIILAVIAALFLSQTDSLQQRTLLPQPTLQAIDFEATLAAGDLTVIVITGEASQSELPTITPTQSPAATVQVTIEETPESSTDQLPSPSCSVIPDGWLPYRVKAEDTLRSLAINFRVDEDSLVTANCLSQPQLEVGQIIYLPDCCRKP